MIFYKNTVKRIGAYFHEEDGATELRIPLGPRSKKAVKRILEVSQAEPKVLAGEAAHWAIGYLVDFASDGDSAGNFAESAVENYEQQFVMLYRFYKAGWVRRFWLDDLLQRAREQTEYDTPKNVKQLWEFLAGAEAQMKGGASYVLPAKYRRPSTATDLHSEGHHRTDETRKTARLPSQP